MPRCAGRPNWPNSHVSIITPTYWLCRLTSSRHRRRWISFVRSSRRILKAVVMSVALTKSRLSNAIRCYSNYALSLFGLVRITHMPTFVSVEPANVCQLRCPECPVGLRNRQSPITNHQSPMIPVSVWQRTLAEVKDTAHTIQFYFQGEPLLNPDLPFQTPLGMKQR